MTPAVLGTRQWKHSQVLADNFWQVGDNPVYKVSPEGGGRPPVTSE